MSEWKTETVNREWMDHRRGWKSCSVSLRLKNVDILLLLWISSLIRLLHLTIGPLALIFVLLSNQVYTIKTWDSLSDVVPFRIEDVDFDYYPVLDHFERPLVLLHPSEKLNLSKTKIKLRKLTLPDALLSSRGRFGCVGLSSGNGFCVFVFFGFSSSVRYSRFG